MASGASPLSNRVLRFADWLTVKVTYIPNHGPCQTTHTTRTYLVLFEDSVNSEYMIQYLIEEHQRYIQFLLVEYLEPGLDIVPQLLLVNWEVVLRQPVTVQYGATKSSLK